MSRNSFPVSPSQTIGGMYYFPRMLDKIRLHRAGRLPEDYHANLGQGMDSWTCQFLHVAYADVRKLVEDGAGDEEIVAWCFTNGRLPNAFEIQMFNEFLSKRGFRDALSERLESRKAEAGAADRTDIQTFFDFIDFDEGRR